jgi:hypothetical protein
MAVLVFQSELSMILQVELEVNPKRALLRSLLA